MAQKKQVLASAIQSKEEFSLMGRLYAILLLRYAASTMNHEKALKRLREGNERFVAGEASVDTFSCPSRRKLLAEMQSPFAVILGCADSRVPAEIVFDQGHGDLFVVRVAGNIAAPSQVGSIEYAVKHLGTRLVVVLGHTGCGAVAATMDGLGDSVTEEPTALNSIVDRIRPAFDGLDAVSDANPRESVLAEGVRANIQRSVEMLREQSPSLTQHLSSGDLLVVGAEYSLETGGVIFL